MGKRLLVVTMLLAFLSFNLVPLLWTIGTSLKPTPEIFTAPPTLWPQTFTLAHYRTVLVERAFGVYVANSLLVGLGATALALVVGALAAYALARFRHPRAGLVEKGILAAALFPPAVLLIPLYQVALRLGLLNTYVILILSHAALNLPFVVWVLTAFFREVPRELEEAARLDGFSTLGILFRIILPLSLPAVAATAILVFIFSWNEFLFALALITTPAKRTVPVMVALLSGTSLYEIPWGPITAAVVATTAPVVAAILIFQRWIVSGLTAGALKG
ncbi:MAG: carbohydrate ABC transporter permease [Desulfobacteraceae bacterium]